MLKSLSAPYREGKRTWDWLKVKKREQVDAVVTGFVDSDGEKSWSNMVGAVEVSCYDENGVLRPVAAVGSMPLETRAWLTVMKDGKPVLRSDVYGKVLVVAGQEWTKNLRLKHATWEPYGGWGDPFRGDKAPEDCKVDFIFLKKKVDAGERV